MRGEILAVPTPKPAPNSPSAASCGFEPRLAVSLGPAPAHVEGGKPPGYSWRKGKRLELTEVQVGFDSRSKIRRFLMFPAQGREIVL